MLVRRVIMGAMRMLYPNVRKYPAEKILVDDDIYEMVKDKLVWVSRGQKKEPVSVRISERGDKNGVTLSRLIMKPPKGMIVDHLSRDVLDNRRVNLRICTQAENTRNKTIQSNNTSGIPSVRWQKDANMWRVRIKYLGNKIHIGYFKNKIEAGYVRDQITMQLHKEFARTYII